MKMYRENTKNAKRDGKMHLMKKHGKSNKTNRQSYKDWYDSEY